MHKILIDQYSRTPKYKQIVKIIELAIEVESLKIGDKLPSLNSIKEENKLSRDTVLLAFNELKTRGIINSIVGKGYYLVSTNINISKKIFLLFDELNSFKEDLYGSFLKSIGQNTQVDIFFHHFNFNVFKKLIHENVGLYNYFAIMPANFKKTVEVLEILPKGKVYILDQIHDDLLEYPAIYQNFEKIMYNGMFEAKELIKKYSKAILVYNERSQPEGLLNGFISFCKFFKINHLVVENSENLMLKKGELLVILDDMNLIKIVKKIKSRQFKLSKDIGIISYNDNILKEIIDEGITTISTDFKFMGERLSQMILKNENLQIENPNSLILRKSL